MLLIYIPEIVVSDSGTAFTGIEFSEFMARNGIWHLRTAPYHTVNNGLAEHAVQMFKTAMRKSSNDSIDARFLFHYRTTPNSTTGVSPDELLMGVEYIWISFAHTWLPKFITSNSPRKES